MALDIMTQHNDAQHNSIERRIDRIWLLSITLVCIMSFSITALSITKLRIITQNQDAQHDYTLFGVGDVLILYGAVLTKTAQHNDVQHNDTMYKELSITSLSMSILG
jgi:hypothetical protein